ncbi:hypothetical protein C6499_19090 [Candidatus Poribacteria bacterium]|nr:MAG: hypothetical protein C6499_19090 [Candidatus Poribacteria bacterium]
MLARQVETHEGREEMQRMIYHGLKLTKYRINLSDGRCGVQWGVGYTLAHDLLAGGTLEEREIFLDSQADAMQFVDDMLKVQKEKSAIIYNLTSAN